MHCRRGEEPSSLLEEMMSDQGETESLTESTEGGVPSTSALDAANTVKFKVRKRAKSVIRGNKDKL